MSAKRTRILVVDDEANQRDMLERILGRAGYEVTTAASAAQALATLSARGGAFDLLLTDQRLGGMDGLELLDRVRAEVAALPVVLMTAYGSVATAVEAMKRGAADYLTKPFDKDELLLVLAKVLRQRRLEQEVRELRGTLRDRYRVGSLIGSSAAMQEVFSIIERVAATDVPVLVLGESGTGKELVARAIHENGKRADKPFVALNCAAVPESLLESEFFGHERGAFTGAERAHAGRFEQADEGTLFLDEIGAMRVDLQAKLLRAIQEREVQRLGSRETRSFDVHIVAATSADLARLIKQGAFREDLYYRLNVLAIHLPPLRERDGDIPALVATFVKEAAKRQGRKEPEIAPEVLDVMLAYHWPGNVRELKNCVERMVVLGRGDRVALADLPPAIARGPAAAVAASGDITLPAGGVSLPDLERSLIAQALERGHGNLRKAARLVGLSYKTLQYRVRKFKLDRDGPET